MVPEFQFDSRGFNFDPIWEIPIAFCIEYFKLGENSQAFYSVLVFILYANASCVIGSPISYLPCPLYFLHYYKSFGKGCGTHSINALWFTKVRGVMKIYLISIIFWFIFFEICWVLVYLILSKNVFNNNCHRMIWLRCQDILLFVCFVCL